VFEVLTSTGKYYWIPLDSVVSIQLHPVKRPRDLLWRQTQMTVLGGPDGEVYLPCLYAGSHLHADERLRLGRQTDWTGGDGEPVRGMGLKTFLVGDESKTILEIQEVTFDSPVPAVATKDSPGTGA
jgi:type VI secretion system protein ImpE